MGGFSLGNQVMPGDGQLFLWRIPLDGNYLHTVQKRARHVFQAVGRGQKHHLRQIKGNIQIKVAEGMVLLTVQDLQHRRRRIPQRIMTHFIDFIQQAYGIGTARLGNPRQNPSRDRADIGTAVPSQLCLIPKAAQGGADKFAVQAPGNRSGDRGLSHTGGTHQAKDRPLQRLS